MDSILELRGLVKHFPNHRAVNGISLKIPRGGFYSLLGPSGCGKTTTLRLIAGFEEPTSGEVLLDGAVVNEQKPYQRNVSTVFQNYALFPHLTAAENIAFGLKRKNQTRYRAAGSGRARAGAAHRQGIALPGAAFRRRAAARGAGAIAGAPAGRAAARRAAGRARSEAAQADAPGAEGNAAARGDHVSAGHARPGRGAFDVRSVGGDERRRHRTGGHAARCLPAPPVPVSSRVSWVR